MFFDLKGRGAGKARYSWKELLSMEEGQLREAVSAYEDFLFASLLRGPSGGSEGAVVFDPEALLLLGLPADAGEAAVKKRFRELAKRYHPDLGGDAERFIQLTALYRRLFPKKS